MNFETQTPKAVLESVCTASDCLSVSATGDLLIEGCAAPDLVAQFGSPLFVLSDSTLLT